MQIDALALQLRPRPMFEAADLGVRLAQSNAASAWRCYAPLWAATTLLALSTIDIAGWLPWVLLYFAKPWLDRTLLFVFSRAAFGEATRWGDLWAARRQVWGGQLLDTFTMRRLSPWRAFVQPAMQLEGQRGAAARARRKQLLRGKRGAASAMPFVFSQVELVLMLALYGFIAWMTPGDNPFSMLTLLDADDGLGLKLSGLLAYALATLFVEPFHVAAGFAMYLNRRVELEAWDIEREFRRAFAA